MTLERSRGEKTAMFGYTTLSNRSGRWTERKKFEGVFTEGFPRSVEEQGVKTNFVSLSLNRTLHSISAGAKFWTYLPSIYVCRRRGKSV